MKNKFFFILFIFLPVFLLPVEAGTQPDETFFFGLWGGYLYQADGDFREYYGSGGFSPGMKAGVNVYNNFYLWGSYDYFSKKGSTQVFQYETTFTQHFFSIGAGAKTNIGPALDLDGEIGFCRVKYREEALGEEYSDSAPGYRFNVGIRLRITRSFFGGFSFSYISVPDKMEEYSFKLGGIKTAVGLGFYL